MGVEVSRRAALRGIGAAVVGRGATDDRRPGAGRQPAPAVTAMTRNLYLGADLFALFLDRDGSPASVVGSLLRQVDESAVDRRMGAVADTVEAARPDVVGVQEAALVRTGRPSDGRSDDPDATGVRYDFLALLRDALADRGLAYDVAAVSENTDAEFPAAVDDGRIDVRLTDRDALLVRRGTTTVERTATGVYDTAFTVPVGEGFTLTRGYATADLRVRGRPLTAATTHLEPASAGTRAAQARAFRDALSGAAPAVALGDFNDGPADDGGAYEVLDEGFTDAYAATHSDADAPTCCFPPSLREGDPETALTERYDVVFARELRATDARRVGIDPGARVAAGDDLLWPSDHAGVVASFGGESTATATGSPTPTPTDTPTPRPGTTTRSPTSTARPGARTPTAEGTAADTTASTGPGFGAALAGVAALAAGAVAALRSDDEG